MAYDLYEGKIFLNEYERLRRSKIDMILKRERINEQKNLF